MSKFDEWWLSYTLGKQCVYPDADRDFAQDAYRAGEASMRERAAELNDEIDPYHSCGSTIRALPLDGDKNGAN